MGWTEQQRRMLAELGIPHWLAPPAIAAAAVAEPARVVEAAVPALVEAVEPPLARVAPPAGSAVAGVDQHAGAIAALDWDGLRERVANCTACGLCEGRTQTVFGGGNRAAHWMIVGEAPGEQEDRQGEPFVGRSGQLLDNMLRALQLTRADGPPARQVFITNALKCRPGGNRNPTAAEVATCEPYLMRQIALVQPRIILAMGRVAVQGLLRSSEPIGRLRGRIHQYQGVPLVVTYHPAYLLRNPQDKARAWDDLCLAAETAAGTGVAVAPGI